MKGIIIIALGHPYYGQMAANLACSIKLNNKAHITLFHNDTSLKHLDEKKKSLFDNLIECPYELMLKLGRENYLKPKLYLYDLSPYEETIYIDADMLWLDRSLESLWKEFENIDFTMENKGAVSGFYSWGKTDEIKKAYNINKILDYHAQLIYFKKTEKVKAFFQTAQQVFDEPKVKFKDFAGDIPDEPAFSVASELTGVQPHKIPYTPCYWEHRDKKQFTDLKRIRENYFMLSAGGRTYDDSMKKKYDLLVTLNSKLMGISFPYMLKKKSSFLKERTNL